MTQGVGFKIQALGYKLSAESLWLRVYHFKSLGKAYATFAKV